MGVEGRDSLSENFQVDESVADEGTGKGPILFSPGDEFGEYAVVWVEAEAATGFSPRRGEDDDALMPAFWKDCGGGADSLGVVAEGAVEGREFSDGAIHEIGLGVIGVVEEGDVDLHGRRRLQGEFVFVVAAENGLAADDEDVVILGDT